MVKITLDRIVQKLSLYKPKEIEDRRAKRAGVFVPIYGKEEKLYLILTKRSLNLRNHKGEICFPGGSCEKIDLNPKETAIRESFEEIGLRREDLRILGRLDDTYTKTGYLISPYVGTVLYPYTFRLNREEVDYLIFLPIESITVEDFERKESLILNNGERVFGATLRILKNLSSVILL